MLPNFLYIGPPKSASTWLYEVLAAHPQVFVPTVKDLYFFDRYYDKGLEWYAAHFAGVDHGAGGAHAVGELSHDYLYDAKAAARIAADLDAPKLITILRQPMDRTLSEFRFLQRSGLVGEDFAEALQARPEDMRGKSLYGAALAPYWAAFDPAQIATFVYDDLVTDAGAFANAVYEFLGVSALDELAVEGRVNAQSAARSAGLARLAKLGADGARALGLSGLVGRVKRHPLVLKALYKAPKTAPVQIPRAVFEDLSAAFTADLAALETLTGRKFPTLAMDRFDMGRVRLT